MEQGGEESSCQALKATRKDLEATLAAPIWQTDWTTKYIMESGFDIYALKTKVGELVALGAYEIGEAVVAVHIVYMECHAGFNGDVTLNAKTPELAKHYERDFGAIPLPGRGNGSAPRYLICDEAAIDIFTSYLEEG